MRKKHTVNRVHSRQGYLPRAVQEVPSISSRPKKASYLDVAIGARLACCLHLLHDSLGTLRI